MFVCLFIFRYTAYCVRVLARTGIYKFLIHIQPASYSKNTVDSQSFWVQCFVSVSVINAVVSINPCIIEKHHFKSNGCINMYIDMYLVEIWSYKCAFANFCKSLFKPNNHNIWYQKFSFWTTVKFVSVDTAMYWMQNNP